MKELTAGELIQLLQQKSPTAHIPKIVIDHWFMLYGREIVKDDVLSRDVLDTTGAAE